MAVAMVISASVPVRPTSLVGSCKASNVAWNVESAALKVPKADTCAFSAVLLRFMAFVTGAALAVVSAETMEAMSSPDPTPCDEMTVLGSVVVGAVDDARAVVMIILSSVFESLNLSATTRGT